MTEAAPVSHRPLGSGHPYRIDPDQRHPVHPVAGEPLELRVLASARVAAVAVELAQGVETMTMDPVDLDALYPTATTADGHLAAASGARPDVGGSSIWRAVLPAAPDEPFRYRFAWRSGLAAGTTEWFAVLPGRWTSGGGELAVDGDGDRLIPESVEWLVTVDGPVRARFALRLDPDEHVLGFGERFDVLDQRGRTLDAVVFEQYKQQGSRTYLPSRSPSSPAAKAGASMCARRGARGSTSAATSRTASPSRSPWHRTNRTSTCDSTTARQRTCSPPTSQRQGARSCRRRGSSVHG